MKHAACFQPEAGAAPQGRRALSLAGIQVARELGLSCFANVALTDSNTPDFQAGLSSLFGKSVSFSAVDSCSFGVRNGEVVSLVGESGCGKTTLGKTMIGLIKPTHGTVLYEGRDIWRMKGKEYSLFRRNAQIIHQDPYASLHPVKRVYT
jgi:ABC-type oligopeptide transport system ATPase subunit